MKISQSTSPKFIGDLSRTSNVQQLESKIIEQQATRVETFTPQTVYSEQVAQLINSRYLFELKRSQKKVIRGRKLKELLTREYSFEEFQDLPVSMQNLIKFDKAISSAEVLQFIEELDKSHEIYFRDYSYDSIKFRALFEALGELLDVEMQAGPSTFVPLSEGFEIKRKVKKVFVQMKDKIVSKLFAKKKKTVEAKNESRNEPSRESVQTHSNSIKEV